VSKLAEIKARLEAATPGPWKAWARDAANDGTQDEMVGLGWEIVGPPEPMRGQFSRCADAQFIAHSHEDVALLVAVVEAEMIGGTPQEMAKGYREMSEQRYLEEWRRERSANRGKAWLALS
jgi:hypothetical protein